HQRLFLQATAGNAAERLYQKLGFKTEFIRCGYRLKDWPQRQSAAVQQERSRFLQTLHSVAPVNEAAPLRGTQAYCSDSFDVPATFPQQIQSLQRKLKVG